ncbi:MAG: porin [Armatimonadota bacterium]|nr:porin [Armatimonadota bacterium]
MTLDLARRIIVPAVTVASLVALEMCLPPGAEGQCPRPGSYWKCPVTERPGEPRPGGLTARVQARYSHTQSDPDQPTWLVRDDRAGYDDYNTRRLRLAWSHQPSDDLLVFAQIRRDWGADEFEWHDLYATWSGLDWGNLTVGQMMTPFDRQFMTSDVKLPVAERPRSSILLIPNRDIGALLHGTSDDGCVGWYAGLYLGNGKNELDATGDPISVARLEWLATENLNVGANWALNKETRTSTFRKLVSRNGDPLGLAELYRDRQVDEEAWGLDAIWREGPTSVWAGYNEKGISASGHRGVTASGCYAQLSRFVPCSGAEDKLELVGGWEEFDPGAAAPRLEARWLTLGANYHIEGCARQVRLQYVHRDEAVGEVDNDTVLLQYDHIFK